MWGVVQQAAVALLAFKSLSTLTGLLGFLYRWYLRPAKNFTKHGKWAIVTGATDGIGRAYAFELAKNKLNIVLVSRTEAKLEAVQKEILAKYPKLAVEYIVADFDSEDEDALFARLAGETKKYEQDGGIAVLINNVGISYRYAQHFHELSEAEVKTLIKMNCTSTARFTHLVLPHMVERKKGFIVNMSSGSALSKTGLLALYSGAKSLITLFSQSLNDELRGKVKVQACAPYMVASKLSKMRPSLIVPTPKKFASYAVKQIGYESETTGHPLFDIQYGIRSLIPALYDSQTLNFHFSIRKRGQKKDARIAAEKKKDN